MDRRENMERMGINRLKKNTNFGLNVIHHKENPNL
jgi:hypothetical protein